MRAAPFLCLDAMKKVEGFCCPVPSEPLESPSVARWGPTALMTL